jgi:hypothetical protein
MVQITVSFNINKTRGVGGLQPSVSVDLLDYSPL